MILLLEHCWHRACYYIKYIFTPTSAVVVWDFFSLWLAVRTLRGVRTVFLRLKSGMLPFYFALFRLLLSNNILLSNVMSDKALGLIETKGLIGAIVATDAAAKAAAVVVSSVELTDATFLTLKIEGDLGAVQAAVEAGSEACEKVGELIAAHVIPNPDGGLGPILPNRRYVSKYHPDDQRPPLDLDDSEMGQPKKPKPPKPTPTRPAPPKEKVVEKKKDDLKDKNLEDMTVSELRRVARSLNRIELKGREISMANKDQLLEAIRNVLDMD